MLISPFFLHLMILAGALGLDRLVGDPPRLWRRVPHPVVVFGRLIGWADEALNDPELAPDRRRRRGVIAMALLSVLAFATGLGLHLALTALGWAGLLLELLIVAVFLAQKSLFEHVAAVADSLQREGLEGGRRAVAQIVGRDPETLDRPGVCRAAIESLAENFSDGLVAPAFWFAVLGLPGLMAYKMINTADSMIGHLSSRHRDFGWAAARLDDVVNWPAARLSAALLAIAAAAIQGMTSGWRAISTARRDAGVHRSPNAGWPECAMAGALDLPLGGPRRYGEVVVAAVPLNAAGSSSASVARLRLALSVAQGAAVAGLLLVLGVALVAALIAAG
ncbi:adenosylcobinamide-phosphate synthase CbiB [Pseudohoeflea coraliihabitans]|uniref:Cobalamin biosynthesis protein CobD n=1 Tax=Pseudohoeflea coraliihabitans TaxID=2860393 RepID=A0ABS6WIF5_9HYPH|nr:adenosylcobinamide-phosphate synthase CbiB [Pseudohoeflea sp. DP4N28-3]MBW3095737.1 adenosylcobinamide-phosphate synthase CbiB [Pseudohoeflea sp. DP4N28-3]